MRRRVTALLTGFTLLTGLVVVAPAATAQGPAATVQVGDNLFDPAQVAVDTGDTVQWQWVGNRPHNVTFDDLAVASPTQTTGTFDVTFPEPGTYTYFCSIHGRQQQSGAVTVTGDPVDPPVDPPVGRPARVSGDDPVETALSWSGLIPDGGAATALIGTTGGFADSLASGGAQGALEAPLLLTDGAALDDRVAAELDRLGTTRVVILGGVQAIEPQVETELDGLVDTVDRVGGDTRLATSRLIADLTAPDASTVIVARAFGEGTAAFADALAAGAASSGTGYPTVLTPSEGLDPGLAAWLQDRGVDRAFVVGGPLAVSEDVIDELVEVGVRTTRLEGTTRFSTAAAVRGELGDAAATPTLVEGTTELAWASGFAAALSASGGVVLSAGDEVPEDTLESLRQDTADDVVCGPTVGVAACERATAAAGGA